VSQEFPIVFALFSRVTQLDFTGPYEVLSRLPGARSILASVTGNSIEADGGMTFSQVVRLADVDRCALLCVPGGFGTIEAMEDFEYLAEMALTVVGEIAGTDFAEVVRLGIEYAPAPPFDAGGPERARPEIITAARRRLDAIAREA
jgi:hypothetical protein